MSKLLHFLGSVVWFVLSCVFWFVIGWGVMYVIEFFGLPGWTGFIIYPIIWITVVICINLYSDSRKPVYDKYLPKVKTRSDEIIKPITTGKHVEYRESYHIDLSPREYHIKFSPAVDSEIENNYKTSLCSYANYHNLWICSYCESFNSKSDQKCVICGLGEQR